MFLLKVFSFFDWQPGISLILINLSNNTSFEVNHLHDQNLHVTPNFKFEGSQQREEYHLTPKDGNILSDVVLLNETPLKLTNSLDIPKLNPKLMDASTPIIISPHSILYVTIRDFNAPACA